MEESRRSPFTFARHHEFRTFARLAGEAGSFRISHFMFEYFMIIDTHSHVQFNAYQNDWREVLLRCEEKDTVVNLVGTHKDTSVAAVKMATDNEGVYATIGLHPIHLFSKQVDEEESSFLSREEEFDYEFYKKLGSDAKVVGIGECGIDLYHIPTDVPRDQIIAKQIKIFLLQAKLAKELDLPLVIHTRDAYTEMAEVLQRVIARSPDSHRDDVAIPSSKEQSINRGITTLLPVARNVVPLKGTVHCFSSNWTDALKFLNLGFYLGFTGVITFPPKKKDPQPHLDLWQTVKNTPLDKILIETDCPYLAPVPYRGKRGEPWMVVEVAKKIAELKNLSLDEVVNSANANALKLFRKIKI